MNVCELVSPEKAILPCKKVKEVESLDYFRKLYRSLIATALKNDGVGIAAPQIGIYLKIFAAYLQEYSGWTIFFNPKYKSLKGNTVKSQEGCLTLGKDNKYNVTRYTEVLAEWEEYNLSGLAKKKRILTGLSAIIFQHETDHINGITIASKGEKIKSGG